MPETITLDKELAKDLRYISGSLDGWRRVVQEWYDEWRWGNEWRLVIANENDEYYATYFRDSSGDGGWHSWDDLDEVAFARVYPREIMTIEYVEAG